MDDLTRGSEDTSFDLDALLAAQQEAESGNYVTGTTFFAQLRDRITARREAAERRSSPTSPKEGPTPD